MNTTGASRTELGIPLKVVGAAAGQMATGVAKDAAKAAGNFLRRISCRRHVKTDHRRGN